jgi:hypothetical protein
MMKAALFLSALAVATGSAAFAAPPGVVHNQPQKPLLAYGRSASLMGSVAAVLVLPDAKNPNVPGATGQTVVPGDNSTIAGDRAATVIQRDGAYGGD